VPSAIVERALVNNHAVYLAQPKADGSPRRDTSQRNLYPDERNDGAIGHGYALKWAKWRNAWDILA
jgi:hypothetical protein